ncbi:LOW QUALITY PROTEIN: avidin-related protein 1-like [Strix aluco]|uniref:LOW QUALITY PROTEIN: avidin-related protein 1-like n=1 Tax=Strix aluco TaxID=111821 RepID=UPI003DA3432C
MVQVTPFLLVLSLALMAHGLSEKCVLIGHWKNDLGSNMTIGELRNFITFNSTYVTAVSMSPKNILKSPLLGSQQHTHQPTFNFTVNWTFTVHLMIPRLLLQCPQCSPILWGVPDVSFPCP